MTRCPRRQALLVATWLAAASSCAQAAEPTGSNETEVRRMIDSLNPGPVRQRNLIVRQRPQAASAAQEAPAPVTPVAAPAAPGPSDAADEGPSGAAPALSLAIGFAPNSSQLQPESGATLGALMAAMLAPELRDKRFVIEGHTDATGSPQQNQRLSQQRAEEVRLFLVTLGVAPERLRAVGRGSSEPANAADPRAAENRRVRVVTLP